MIPFSIQQFGAALLPLCLAFAAFGEDPAHAPSPPPKPSEDKIQVLDDSIQTNGPVSLKKIKLADQYQVMLEAARQQRDLKDLTRAERTLIQLLESRAPEEIKRPALLHLALVMHDQKAYTKAQRLYSEYVRRFPNDVSVPEVLLKQAYLYRDMGLPDLATSKFFAVMSACLNLQVGELDYYQKLVLRAQIEIAETFYLQGKFADAAEYLNKALKLESQEFDRADLLYKLARCYWQTQEFNLAAGTARLCLEKYPDAIETPETRFLLADSLKKLGQDREAVQEILVLLQKQEAQSADDPQQWLYWQQKAGNDIANQFYRQGDYLNALQVYESLASLNDAAAWQVPVWYQIGLIYENLKQYPKASETYDKILGRQKSVKKGALAASSVTAVLEMARWRKEVLTWEAKSQAANKELKPPSKTPEPAPGASSGS